MFDSGYSGYQVAGAAAAGFVAGFGTGVGASYVVGVFTEDADNMVAAARPAAALSAARGPAAPVLAQAKLNELRLLSQQAAAAKAAEKAGKKAAKKAAKKARKELKAATAGNKNVQTP